MPSTGAFYSEEHVYWAIELFSIINSYIYSNKTTHCSSGLILQFDDLSQCEFNTKMRSHVCCGNKNMNLEFWGLDYKFIRLHHILRSLVWKHSVTSQFDTSMLSRTRIMSKRKYWAEWVYILIEWHFNVLNC